MQKENIPAVKLQCPRCMSREIRFRQSDNSYLCRRCGWRWLKEETKETKHESD